MIELLIVIAIIALLGSVIFISLSGARNRAYGARTKAEMRAIGTAMELYFMDNNYQYPCDANRGMPPGLVQYLSSNPEWPKAPWPGSVYDWDYWVPNQATAGCKNPLEGPPCTTSGYCAGALSYSPNTGPVYQLSVRFCDINGANCRFPDESWAAGFDSQSSAYWCIGGACRAHGSATYNHSGCCMGGACPAGQPTCGF